MNGGLLSLMKAEWRKVTTTKLLWILILASIAFNALNIVILVLVAMRQRDEPPSPFSNDAAFQDFPIDPKNYSGPDPKPESATPTEPPPTTPPTTNAVPLLEQSSPPLTVPGRGVPLDPERPMRNHGQPGPPGEIE